MVPRTTVEVVAAVVWRVRAAPFKVPFKGSIIKGSRRVPRVRQAKPGEGGRDDVSQR